MILTLNLDAYPQADAEALMGALGLIPYFFVDAMLEDPETLQDLADRMDGLYGFGGFRFPMEGTVESDGRYTYPEDPDLEPYAILIHGRYTCLIYPYAITAITDDKGNSKIARFD